MKRNLILFALLSVLLTYTYYSEEIGTFKFGSNQFDTLAKFKLEDIRKVKLKNALLLKKKNNFVVKKYDFKADDEQVKSLFDVLSHLKMVREIPNKDLADSIEKFVPLDSPFIDFELKNKSVRYTFGKKQDFSKRFYLKQEVGKSSRIVVAEDNRPVDMIVDKSTAYKSSVQYDNLISVLNWNSDEFLNRSILELNESFSKIKIKNNRNIEFSVTKNGTTPSAPNGISYEKKFIAGFFDKIYKMKSKMVLLKYNPKILKNKISSFWLDDKGPYEIYSKYGSLAGYFLVKDDKLYELKKEQSAPFFLNVQEFWEKSVVSENNKIHQNENIVFQFPKKEEKVINLEIKQHQLRPSLLGKSKTKVNPSEINKLISLLGTPADVLHSNMKESKQSDFKLKLKEWNLDIIFEDKILKLVDRKKKVSFYYFVGKNSPISLKYNNYFEND